MIDRDNSNGIRKLPGNGKQRGVAIITALLIVTIAATVSITISSKLQLDVRRTSNMVAKDQANFYLLAAESWSQRILRQDKKDNSVDGLSEDWAIELPPIPVAGGSIRGRLTDLHSCININSLIVGAPVNSPGIDAAAEEASELAEDAEGAAEAEGIEEQDTKIGGVRKSTQVRLNQLFTNLEIDSSLTQSITDWIDDDLNTTNPNGAEDGYYLNLEKPYHTANAYLQSISELRMIKGFEDSKIYNLVKDHLCAFIPDGGSVAINVNTASSEVLKSLSAKMTDNIVKDIIDRRDEELFKDISDFTSFAKLETIIEDKTLLTTSSDYFLLRTQAVIGPANRIMYSIIHRNDNGETRVISRVYRTL